jgi:hypothetical protein
MIPDNDLFDFSKTADLDDDEIASAVEPSPKLDTEPIMALNSDETALEVIEAPTNGAAPKEAEQAALFDKGEWWEEAWKGMPAFEQKDLAPWKSIYVHFENRSDMEGFAKLIGQQVGLNTRSIWWPESEICRLADKRYVDPEEISENVEVMEIG